jgi:hypothetical protein
MPPKKKPAAPLTLEERIAAAAARRGYDSYALDHMLVPATPLAVGDEVFLGNLDDAVVVAVLDEGRRVAVEHTAVQLRGATSPAEKTIQVVPAYGLQRKDAPSPESFSTPNHYRLLYSQREVASLMSMLSGFGVDMSPEYQRELVWEPADKVRLIDSIFNQVDIGKFVFRKLPFQSGGPSYEVVDGKQRLSALAEFMADQFAYRGKTWSQLSRTDRHYIDSYSISYAELAETYTRTEVLELFVRLNTGGKPMDPAHLDKVAALARQDALQDTSASKPARRKP